MVDFESCNTVIMSKENLIEDLMPKLHSLYGEVRQISALAQSNAGG